MTMRKMLDARGMFALGAIAGLGLIAGCGGGSDEPDEPATLTPEEIVAQASPGVVEIVGKQGDEQIGGSGFIYDAGPPVRILTAEHVVAGTSNLQVKVGDQLPPVSATVLGQAPCDDVAVLELPEPPPEISSLSLGDSDNAASGSTVVALGYPDNFQRYKQQTVNSTNGTVSNPDLVGNQIGPDLPAYPALIQHNASLNPGNSGGPLLNDQGEVVGINVLGNTGGSQGQFYSIDINAVEGLLPDLEAGNNPGYVGWALAPMDLVPLSIQAFAYIDAYDLPVDTAISNAKFDRKQLNGMYSLQDAEAGSPADGKVQFGDVITEIDGTSVKTVNQVCKIVESKAPGDTMRVTRVRLTSLPKIELDYDKATSDESIELAEDAATTGAESTTSETTSTSTGE